MYKFAITVIAIICIAGLEFYALYLGHDGTLLAGAVAVIAGLGGYATKTGVQAKRDSVTAKAASPASQADTTQKPSS